jgi:hypothetical protein
MLIYYGYCLLNTSTLKNSKTQPEPKRAVERRNQAIASTCGGNIEQE